MVNKMPSYNIYQFMYVRFTVFLYTMYKFYHARLMLWIIIDHSLIC